MPAGECIAMSWQPTQADYREVSLMCARRRRRIVFGIAGGLGLLNLVVGVLASNGGFVGVGVGLLAYVLVLWAIVHLRAGAGFWKHDFLRSAKTATLDPGVGVEVTSPESTARYAWTAFATCQETEHLLVLRLLRSGRRLGAFLVLPKRGFADPAEVERARALIRASVSGGVNPV